MLSNTLSWPGTVSLVKVDIHVLNVRIQVCATTPDVCSAGVEPREASTLARHSANGAPDPAQGTFTVYMSRDGNTDNTWAS